MLRVLLLTIFLGVSTLMACNVCDEIAKAQAKVDYTYKMYKLSTTKDERQKWLVANTKAQKSLTIAKALPVSHGND